MTQTTKEEFIVALKEPEHAFACIVDEPLYDGNAKEINNFYRRNSGHEIRRVNREMMLEWMNNYLRKYKGAA